MKTALLAIALLAAWPASADAVQDKIDDYMACLIGQSAIAILHQGSTKDADAAQDVAYSICKEPKELATIDGDISHFVDDSVMAIAIDRATGMGGVVLNRMATPEDAPAPAEVRDSEMDEAYSDCMSEPGQVSDAAGLLTACMAAAVQPCRRSRNGPIWPLEIGSSGECRFIQSWPGSSHLFLL